MKAKELAAQLLALPDAEVKVLTCAIFDDDISWENVDIDSLEPSADKSEIVIIPEAQ